MDTRQTCLFSFVEGRISGIQKARIVSGFFFNGGYKVLKKDDPAIPHLEQVAKERKRILCLFSDVGNLSRVIAVYVEPKGEKRKRLLSLIEVFIEEGSTEFAEIFPPNYAAQGLCPKDSKP